ncbi:hypothetical protein RFI_11163, partial [Reticulomyxa filosa]
VPLQTTQIHFICLYSPIISPFPFKVISFGITPPFFFLKKKKKGNLRVELCETKKMSSIQGHDSSLGTFALSVDGKLLATASEKGTLIRIWNTATGEKIQELRRGADQANIQRQMKKLQFFSFFFWDWTNSICFSPETSKWLAVASDKGTVHIFKLKAMMTSLPKSPPASTDKTKDFEDETLEKLIFFKKKKKWNQMLHHFFF